MAEENADQELKDLLLSLPKVERPLKIILYKGFWYLDEFFGGAISFQKHFEAQDKDIIITSFPKSGATWLKALIFSIINRTTYSFSNNPLLASNSHELVPFFECDLFNKNELPDLTSMPSPRIFGSHVPYSALPDSIKKSDCKIVHLCRNPFDVVVSFWYFVHEIKLVRVGEWHLEEFFKLFFEGEFAFGPFWDYVLEYWNVSLAMPNKVFFLKYEELKEDTASNLKRLAEFLGFPFTQDEEGGVIEEIIKLCSLSNLKNLEVNKDGILKPGMPNKVFFRKGVVGDWNNHLSPSMKDYLVKIMKEKLSGSGLSFKLS